jgi:asparagine synthase (glutamine-hydrolysing)
MCGIIGTAGSTNLQYESLLKSICHRGPDSEGSHIENDVSLGHTRLAIQDLSENGKQPMYSPDGRYVIIFNGEIYNHQDLRDQLKYKYDFTSTSDTQTILFGYLEYGPAVLKMLNGIFALAIYDNEKRNLFIARDQLGVKPLYYYFKNGTLIFGSEIKSFLLVTGFDKSINYEALVNYLCLLWSPGELTPFTEVKKLLPGHYINYEVGNLNSFTVEKFYELPFCNQYSKASEEDIITELDEKLLKAVDRQLLSDVPVAFFLSGGLDSSAIVAMAKRLRPTERLRCYTIKTTDDAQKEGFSDDLTYARLVAKHLDLDLVEVEVDVDIVADFDKMIYHLDEPQADAAPLNVLKICTQARKDGYTVLLGGTAGDDLFSGYRRHQALQFEKCISKVPSFIRVFIRAICSQLPVTMPAFRRLRKAIRNIEQPKLHRMYGYFEWLPLKTTQSLFSKSVQQKIASFLPQQFFFDLLKNIPLEKNNLNQMLYWEMRTFLVDHNLNYTDKLSMAVGVEVRVPFLDQELVEFSTIIPPELKLKGSETKYILKKMMEKYLPHEVIYRSKTGFGAPVRKWILNDLDDKVNSYLSAESINARGIFDYQAINKLIKDTKDGKIDGTYSIWALLSIESWLRQFVDSKTG